MQPKNSDLRRKLKVKVEEVAKQRQTWRRLSEQRHSSTALLESALLNNALIELRIVNAQLCKQNHALSIAVAERTVELKNTLAQLQQERIERHQAETALREQQQFLHTIINSCPNLIFVKNYEGKFTLVNQALADIYGTTVTELIGKTDADFNPNSIEYAQYLAADQEVITNLQTKIIPEETVSSHTGEFRYFQTIKKPLVSSNDQATQILGIATDITEYRKSEARNRALLDAIPDLMIRMTKDGTYLDFIPAKDFPVIMPYADMRGKNIVDIMPPEIAQQRLYYVKQALATGKTQIYEYQLRLNGKCFDQEARIAISGEDEVLVIIRDISERQAALRDRKQAQIALQRLNEQLEIRVEERTAQLKNTISQLQQEIAERQRMQAVNNLLALVVQQATDAIEITNSEAKFEYVNPSFEKVTGYTFSEVIGNTPASLLRSGKHSPAFYDQIWKTVTNGQVWHGNMTGRRKDGSIYEQEATVYPVFAENGVITHYVAVKRDITEYKRTEAALRSSEERFRFLAESIPQQVWIAETSGALNYVNQRVLDYFNCSREQILNWGWQAKIHPEDLPSCMENWLYSLATGTPYEVKFRLYRSDNTYRLHLGRALPWRDRHGNIINWFGTNTDIEDYHQAEAARRKSQEHLQAILDNSPAIIALKDTESRYLLVNYMYEKLFNMKSDETIGKSVYDFWPQEVADTLATNDQKVINSGVPIEVEEYFPHQDGIHTYISHKFPLLNSNGLPYAVCNISTDITDRKRVEFALKESEEKFRRVFEDAPIGMVLVTLETGINLRLNPAFCQMLGYTESELKERTFQQFTHPEDLEKELPLFQQCREGKIATYQMEKRYFKKNQEIIWVNLTVGVIRDSNGNLRHGVCMVEDINQRKQAEIALQQAKDQLQAVLDAVPGFVCWLNSDLQYLGVNHCFANTFNLSPNIFINQKLDFIGNQQPFIGFVQQFFNDSEVATHQVVDIEINNSIHNYLIIAQKYQHGAAVVCVGIDITTRQQAEVQIKASLQEKEVLLKEIHHRVKNNLQVISSLLKLQSGYINDEKTLLLFNDSYNRIKSMALIHEKLYQSQDLAKINAAEYIPSLAANLLRSYSINSQKINLKLELDNIFLDVDTAIPCGLIINELVSNSLKYAFVGCSTGEILISFKSMLSDRLCLIIRDNGIGLPQNFNFRQTESLGLQLVCNLTEQLNGEIALENIAGTSYQLQFRY